MDEELEQKRKAYEEVLASVLRDEDAAVIERYVGALQWYAVRYHRLTRERDELVKHLLSGQLLGPHLVERRGHGPGEGRGPAGRHLSLCGIPELDDPRALGRPQGIEVDIQGQGAVDRQGVQGEQGGGGGGVEELTGHKTSGGD